jgi:hypothetical protein
MSPKVGQDAGVGVVGAVVGVVGVVTGMLGVFGTVTGGGMVVLFVMEGRDTAAGKAISIFLLYDNDPEAPG